MVHLHERLVICMAVMSFLSLTSTTATREAVPIIRGRCNKPQSGQNASLTIKCASVSSGGSSATCTDCCPSKDFACRASGTTSSCLPTISTFRPDLSGCASYKYQRCDADNSTITRSCGGYDYCLQLLPKPATPATDPRGVRAEATSQRGSKQRRFTRSPSLTLRREHMKIEHHWLFPYSPIGIVKVLLRTKVEIPATDLPDHETGGPQNWRGTELDGIVKTTTIENVPNYFGLAVATCSGFLLEDCRLVATSAHCIFYQYHNDSAFTVELVHFIPGGEFKGVETEEEQANLNIIEVYKKQLKGPDDDGLLLRNLAQNNVFYARMDPRTRSPLIHIASGYLQYYQKKVFKDDLSRHRASIASVDYAFIGLDDAPPKTGLFFISKKPKRTGIDGAQIATVAGFPAERSCDRMLGKVEILETTLMTKEMAIVLPRPTTDMPFRRLIFGPTCLLSGISGSPVIQGRLPEEMPTRVWADLFKKGRAGLEELPIFVTSIASGWEDMDYTGSGNDEDLESSQRYFNGPDLLLPQIMRDVATFASILNGGKTSQASARACAPPGLKWQLDTTDTKADGTAWRIRYSETTAEQQVQADKPIPFFPNATVPFAATDERSLEPYPGIPHPGWLPGQDNRDVVWQLSSGDAEQRKEASDASDEMDADSQDDEDEIVTIDDFDHEPAVPETDPHCYATEEISLRRLREHLDAFV